MLPTVRLFLFNSYDSHVEKIKTMPFAKPVQEFLYKRVFLL